MYYDQSNNVRAVGAEALQEHIIEEAEDQQWLKLTWWKLHLRPKHLAAEHIKEQDIPPLPHGLTAVEVLADFMAYLFRCAQTYIEDTHLIGKSLFAFPRTDIDFVLSHPNGWEGAQQSHIRRAAVLAGLVPDTLEGHSRIRLVTEGEASLHFCVSNMLASESLSTVHAEKSGFGMEGGVPSGGVIVIDAGGGTIDVSAYCSTGSTMIFEEIAPAECRMQGSVFVTRRAGTLIKEKLSGSRFGVMDYVEQMTAAFDQEGKIRFRGPESLTFVKFGTIRDTDSTCNIRNGRLRLEGQDVARLFRPSVQSIIDAVNKQLLASSSDISFIFLVGGFAMSDYLFSELQAYVSGLGLTLHRPHSDTGKAVADGAVSFYVDHLVSARFSKFTYGFNCSTRYDCHDPEHALREETVYTSLSGVKVIPNHFDIILPKGSRVSELDEYRRTYTAQTKIRAAFLSMNREIVCHRGSGPVPTFADGEEADDFSTACTVRADTSGVSQLLNIHRGKSQAYFELDIDIVLFFGSTELQAQIAWTENGVEKR
ncbi:hypothetical protein CONPUDRAFT_154610 [Coniophora puteana RWD-64-598 SS2]|uniref:Actin-like ATPase domain-containing protein n=1 Tax=Coniophora puteana (strain RWD-64-598) TaxID=741705 RepID=A0A5M3MPD9_CONPW|nr:uncharacterized protein CONPUDRAFT_154610 [Coniophora puteana RWD-64-598 SS2]EIW80584.1 hypothetical protein CONPUDRAFT_154610 [Coniophora puteana RWD-64-598 SS2]